MSADRTGAADLRERAWHAWDRLDAAIGRMGLLGLAMLTVAAVLAGWVSPERQRRLDALNESLAAVPPESRPTSAPIAHGQPASSDPVASSAEILSELAPAREANDWIRKMNELAALFRLSVPSIRYDTSSATEDRVASIEMTLEAQGAWPSIRGFVAAALNSEPSASLREIRVNRAAPTDTELAVQLRFALLVRTP